MMTKTDDTTRSRTDVEAKITLLRDTCRLGLAATLLLASSPAFPDRLTPAHQLRRDQFGQLMGQWKLNERERLFSDNLLYYLEMQTDCNLALYAKSSPEETRREALWSSRTEGRGRSCAAQMQDDGNFVIYDGNRNPIWSTRTDRTGARYLEVQNDGNAVIYDGAQRALWSTRTVVRAGPYSRAPNTPGRRSNATLMPGEELTVRYPRQDPGTFRKNALVSDGGEYTAILQNDCNFVVYQGRDEERTALWSSHTDFGSSICLATMQKDGNFVIRLQTRRPVWATRTDGNPGAYAVIQDDGNFAIYNARRRPLWSTRTNRRE